MKTTNDNVKTGKHYEATKDLDVAAIAKLVRKDLAAEVKCGDILPAKYSVKILRYAGGQSIRITIKSPLRRTDPAAQNACRRAERLANEYNRDASDHMTDYFNVKFYASATWHQTDEDEEQQTLDRAAARGVAL